MKTFEIFLADILVRFRKNHAALELQCKKLIHPEILILGDSHALVFNNARFREIFPDYFFNVISIRGATVSGLQNPHSKTQAFPLLIENARASKAKLTIVLLGEVDTGFVIWFRSEKYGTPVEVMLDKAIENYQHLLKLLSKKSSIICISAPLPTIQDGQDHGDVANQRKNIKATQHEKTKLTIKFNQKMQSYCDQQGFIYLSFDEESADQNGVVGKHLLSKNQDDHHYDMGAYADMIIKKLRPVLS